MTTGTALTRPTSQRRTDYPTMSDSYDTTRAAAVAAAERVQFEAARSAARIVLVRECSDEDGLDVVLQMLGLEPRGVDA